MECGANRRAVLRALGVAATFTLAGCNAGEDNADSTETTPGPTQDTENDPNPTQTESAPAENGGGETNSTPEGESGELTLTKEAEGTIEWAGSRSDNLTYTTYGNNQRVVYDGEEGPVFRSIRFPPVALDGGIAYLADGEESGTSYGYLVVRGEEQARVNNDEGEYIHLSDCTVDGDPLWSMGERGTPGGEHYHGTEAIETGYDSILSFFEVDGALGYVGQEEDWNRTRGDIVVDGSVVHSEEALDSLPKGIGGEITYCKLTSDGRLLQHGDRQIGGQYTKLESDSDIDWFGEVDGNLAFVTRVREDRIQRDDRRAEVVLWYDGEGVARHQRLSNLSPHSNGLAMTERGIAYEFYDPDTSGVAVEGAVIDANGSLPVSIDGQLAYARDGNTDTVVHAGSEVAEYQNIETIFELDGDLAFLGYTDSDTVKHGEIVRDPRTDTVALSNLSPTILPEVTIYDPQTPATGANSDEIPSRSTRRRYHERRA